jgi:hypothetical protein
MSKSTRNRPTSLQHPTPGAADPTSRRPRMDLSLAQTIGGSLAAATAAAIGSRLGLVGTLTGAALVSVVASVAGALYTSSLRRTGHRVSSALRRVGGGRPGTRTPLRPRRVLAGALTVFAVAAAGITAVELATGTSLGGRHGSTTAAATLHGGGTDQPAPAHPTPAVPSPQQTHTPSPSRTPTPSSAASQPPTAAPSLTAPTPSESPAASPTDGETAATTPSASPSAEPTTGTTPGAADTVSPSAAPEGPQGP